MCEMKIRYGMSEETQTQCDRDHADDHHEGPGLPEFPYQRVSWVAGDRREFTGDWPGYCTRTQGCPLPEGHPRLCAT